MAQDQEESSGLPEEPKNPWLKQFMVLALVVLVGQGVVAYVLVTQQVLPKYFGEDPEQAAAEAEGGEREPVEVEPPVLYEIGELLVNPQDFHSVRYLNVKITLRFDSQATLDRVTDDPVTPSELEDFVRRTLNGAFYRDIDESEERIALRQTLMTAINTSGLLGEGTVTAVYFTQFILM